MPEIRKDPVFGRWVIIASERGRRPNQFRPAGAEGPHACPFCPGQEKETPPSIYTLPDGEGPGWRLRVVLNKYPALTYQGTAANVADGMYDRMDGVGSHEVVIETPQHDLELEDMPVSAVADILKTFILRAGEIKKDPRVKYIMIFKNSGSGAGASLAHPHSQIIAMPMVPIRVVQEIDGALAYREENGECVFCDILSQETGIKKRVVGENANFLSITPYASRFPFETWILPKKHESHFERMAPELARDLAAIVKGTIKKLHASLEGVAYNLIVHSMPVQESAAEYYHWHIEIMPKLNHVAGFEWGTGFYINTVSPEDAAEMMNTGKKCKL